MRKKRQLPAPKRGPIYVRSTLSVGNVGYAAREGRQYTRRANRKARQAGFKEARAYAMYLLEMYKAVKGGGR